MKLKIALLSAVVLVVTGCATSHPIGGLYTELSLPVTATAAGRAPRTGTAECKSILSLVAIGDCSISTAMKQGGITQVDHVDWKAENILGIIGKYTVVVHGQ